MIREEIIKAFKKMQEQHPPKRENEIYVTELLHCTLRPKDETPTIPLIRGTAIHEGLEKLLKEYGELKMEFEKEIRKKYGEYELVGRIDALLEDGTVVEFKSVHTAPPFPYESHIYQVLIYMNMVGSEKGIIVYIGSYDIEEFVIEKSNKYGKDLWEIRRIEDGELTFAEYKIDDNWIYKQIIAYMTKTLIAPFDECKFCKINKTCKYTKIR